MGSEKRASAYLTLTARRNYAGSVSSVTATKVTQSKPTRLDNDQIALRINLTVPASLFDAEPVANITISEDAVVIRPVDVEVQTDGE